MSDDDADILKAVETANELANSGSNNGKKVARAVISVITPVLLRSLDPRIKALGLALNVGSLVFLKKKGKKGG